MQERKTIKLILEAAAEAPANICLKMIWLYRAIISPLKPQTCRFYPSCSNYCYDAVHQYGLIRGSAMGIRRLLKCHPFNPGGYDPVR